MTTGNISSDMGSFPGGKRKSNPIWYKKWSGTNDPTHKIEQNYRMDAVSTSFVECMYLGVPTSYVARGLPDFTRVQELNVTIGGNTSLEALSRLAEQIKGHTFNAAAAFADVERTASLLVGSVNNAIGAYKAAIRGDFPDFVRHLPAALRGDPRGRDASRVMVRGDIPNTFLAIQYGWRPLVQDVIEAFKAFETLRKKQRGFKFKGSAKTPPYNVSLAYGGIGGPYAYCYEKVTYRLQLLETLTTAQSLGIVPEGWFTVAWERVPYSFVIDWFIPIAQALENYAFYSNLSYKLTKTSFRRYNGKNDNLLATGVPNPSWTTGSSQVNGASLLRETNQNLGFVTPNLKSLERALTSTHLLNAAALIWAAIDRRPGSRSAGTSGIGFR